MNPSQELRARVEEAFALRQLREPERHRILRLPSESVGAAQRGRPEWVAFEPTAFVYTFMSFNTLYNENWRVSLQSEVPCEAMGSEHQQIRQFVRFVLGEYTDKEFFHERLQATFAYNKHQILYIMRDLRPFRDPTLKERVLDSLAQLFDGSRLEDSQDRINSILSNAESVLQAIYEVRCNLFHGSKSVLHLASDDPQLLRIAAFRRFLIALVDTFFAKVNRLKGWNPYFEATLRSELGLTA